MRAAQREVKDFNKIADIVARCETVRIGFFGEEYPYIVPLTFGYETADGKLLLYVHGAKEGLRHELAAKNPKVCVEADIFNGYAETQRGVTTTYESVIGFGTIELAGHADSVKGLDLMMAHCGASGYSAEQCMSLGITSVYKITVESVTGKVRTVDN
ncbi:MAG: pyridoxamine 5'-phosphate oxidase family protein [Clostridiales Family XIII bacterium]|jgi:nitroimidazol reductase NimA-like FMN-containing flavoprotein (pyridoxamine 5'-phosphate oxidase superfamily)|nr:pyridoxamine 5'-phosphate oxidase family protein [Clostridiales Family XIII bacterium]